MTYHLTRRTIEFCTADGARAFGKACASLGLSVRPIPHLTDARLRAAEDGKRSFEYEADDHQVETINTYVAGALDAAIIRQKNKDTPSR